MIHTNGHSFSNAIGSDITDADLIYPGQMIQIERDLSDFQIQEAIDHARSRGAWALGVS